MITDLDPPIIKTLKGNNIGKDIAIVVGIHGNEKGPQLEWDWLNSLHIDSGTVYLIFANPTACKLNQRFVNVNLNRRFGKSLNEYPEDKIARKIETILDKCDAMLDLHMYNEAMNRPFVICSAKSNEVAQILPARYIVNLPDDVDGGATDDYMNMNGKYGVCFETGSVERPSSYSEIIKDGVLSFLAKFDLMDHEVKINNAKILSKNMTKIVENKDIKFSKTYSSFDPIHSGEIICVENGKSYRAESDGYILFPRPNNPIGTEAYYTLVKSNSG